MTFRETRKALGWREELLSYEEGDIFGHVGIVNGDEHELFDLVRIVYLIGVAVMVPINEADLSEWEAEHVFDRACEIVCEIRYSEGR